MNFFDSNEISNTNIYFLNEYTGICSLNEMNIRHQKLQKYFDKLSKNTRDSYNKKIYNELNYKVLSLVELALLKCTQKHFYFLKTMCLNKNYFKYCNICNNIILTINGDYTHDKFGNIIVKNPQNPNIQICETLKYKIYHKNSKKVNIIFGIQITDLGKSTFKNQKKINNILYNPILVI